MPILAQSNSSESSTGPAVVSLYLKLPVDSQTAASGFLASVTELASPPGSGMAQCPDRTPYPASEFAFSPPLLVVVHSLE